MKADIKDVARVRHELDHRYIHGIDPGVKTGLNVQMNFRKKSTMYIFGPDYTGKTRFFLFLSLCVAEQHGWKFLIFSPETGDAADIISLLIMMYCGNKNYDNSKFGIPEEDKLEAEKFIQRHYRILEYAKVTQDVYDAADELKEKGWKVDCLCLDPFNALSHDLRGKDRDVYLGEWLTEFDYNAVINERLNVIITHPGKQDSIREEVNGEWKTYFPKADKRQIMWGQEWARKGKNLLSLWRPPSWKEVNGQYPDEGEMIVDVQKRKPDPVGEIGEYKVYFNWRTQRYYNDPMFKDCPLKGIQRDITEPESMKPNLNFTDDVPF